MASLETKQAQRVDYLIGLYELTGGNRLDMTTHRRIAEQTGIPEDEVFEVGRYVTDRGYGKFETMGGLDGHVSISPSGVDEAERLLAERERAGQPKYSTLVILTDQELRQELERLLGELRTVLESEELEPEDRADIESDASSATDQLRAATPNRGVIAASLARIKTRLPSALIAGAAIVQGADVILRRLGI